MTATAIGTTRLGHPPRGHATKRCRMAATVAGVRAPRSRIGAPLRERIGGSVLVQDQGYKTPRWVWQKSLNPKGYGRIRIGGRGGRDHQVHRVAYEQFVGPIPHGLQIDHLCRVRSCCNPTHLEPVTVRENGRRGTAGTNLALWQAAKTHCPRDHPYSGQNLYVDRTGRRHCRTCRHQIDLDRRARQKAARRLEMTS